MNIEETVERFIVNELLVADSQTKLDPEQSLVSSGVIDSLSLLRLVSFLEENFGVVVEDDEVIPENFETLTLIKMFVEEKK